MGNVLFVFAVTYVALAVGTMVKLYRMGLHKSSWVIGVLFPVFVLVLPVIYFPGIKWLTRHKTEPTRYMIFALTNLSFWRKLQLFWGVVGIFVTHYPTMARLMGKSILQAHADACATPTVSSSTNLTQVVVTTFGPELRPIADRVRYPHSVNA